MGADSLVVGLTGPWPTNVETAWLRKWTPFGVILFSRNVTGPVQLQKLCSYLRSIVPELQIMADHEGGPVSQLAAALGRPPSAWTLGKINDVDLTRRVHEKSAQLMVAAGVTWVLAPCADVMTNPHNPVIGVRAFGKDSRMVSRHVQAAVQGLLAGGIQVCLKHWPGHGSTGQDSHLVRSVLTLDSLDEAAPPFHAGLGVGAAAVMVGHLCTGRDADNPSSLPATLDSHFLEITRENLSNNREQAISLIADDITMGGLREGMSEIGVEVEGDIGKGLLEPAVLPLSWFEALVDAGCDLLLIRGLPLAAFPVEIGSELDDPLPQTVAGELINDVPEYQETRRRASVPPEFFNPEECVLWVDLTGGDRWAVAAGTGHGREMELSEVLNKSFGKVSKVLDNHKNTGLKGPFTNVVLVSHRPLAWDTHGIPAWLEELAAMGRIVVMGHPSLEKDFSEALSSNLKSGWQIWPLYDVTGCDLAPQG